MKKKRDYTVKNFLTDKEILQKHIEENNMKGRSVDFENAGFTFDEGLQNNGIVKPAMEYVGFLQTEDCESDDFPVGMTIRGGSANTYSPAGWRSVRPVFDKQVCTDCMICWLACPDQAIVVGKKEMKGFDYYHCKGCGICAEVCPVNCISMISEQHARDEKLDSRGLTEEQAKQVLIEDARLEEERKAKIAARKAEILAQIAAKKKLLEEQKKATNGK